MNAVPHPTDEMLQALADLDAPAHTSSEEYQASGGSNADDALEAARGHLESCSECAERWGLLREVREGLGHDATPRDAEVLWRGIEAEIGVKSTSSPSRRWAWAALWVVGLGLGSLWWTQAGRPTEDPGFASGRGETPLVALNRLASPEASVRMAAVGALEPLLDRASVRDALLDLLRSDPDEHVRLFALDALGPAFAANQVPLEVLLGVLATERSPLIQTDLIVLIRRLSGQEPTDLQNLFDGAPLHPFVVAQLVTL